MRIAVLGTGAVGRTLAGKLAELGHSVVIGTRDVAATESRREADRMGSPPISEWLAKHPAVALQAFQDAGGSADAFVNATNGQGSLIALGLVGADQLAGKVLIDVANPLDFSAGFPPTLSVSNTDSLGERIQRAFPAARVVKTLNTVTAAVMVDPASVGSDQTTVFLSGEDEAAKAVTRGILESFGWHDILDLGGIASARGVEMYLPLWLGVMGALGTAAFNVRVTRPPM